MNEPSTLIDVDERMLKEMVLLGCAVRGEDGVYEITQKFEEWLNGWLEEQIRVAGKENV